MKPLIFLCLALAVTIGLARLRAPWYVWPLPLATYAVVVTWKGVRG